MARNKKFQTNFSGGVLSPSVFGRTDIPAYGNAMAVGRNIVVEAAGGVKRRPGTIFVREYRDMDYVRLFPFRFSTEQQYLIVMYEDPISPGNGFIDIYRDNVLQTQIASAYSAENIKSIDYAQSADTMVITDGEHPIQILRRLGTDSDWELIPAPIINPPQTCDYADPPVCSDTWSAANGYPKYCTFHVGRLWFEGSKTQPQSVWASVTQDFFNFDVGTGEASDSIQDILDTDQINPIVGIYSERRLQVYTTGSEFVNTAELLIPTTSAWKRQSNYGSYGSVAPVSLDGGTLFLDRTGRTIRNFIFNDGEDGYTSDSISMLAEHLIIEPIAMGVLRGRTLEASSFVFVINATGTIAVLNLMRSIEMAAWTEWTTQGNFKDIVVVGEDTYLLVERHGSWILEQLTDAVATDSGAVNNSLTDIENSPVRSDYDNFFGINYDREGRGQVVIVWEGEVIYKVDDFKNGPKFRVMVVDEVFFAFRAFSSSEAEREKYFADAPFTTWYMYSLSKVTVLDQGTDYINGLPHLIGRRVSMVLDGAVFPDEVVVSGDELPGGGYIKTYPEGSNWKYQDTVPFTQIYQEKYGAVTQFTDGHYNGTSYPKIEADQNGYLISPLTYLELGALRERIINDTPGGSQTWTAVGSFTFNPPAGISHGNVCMIGAGGSGSIATDYANCGGGGRGQTRDRQVNFVFGTPIQGSVGAGGTVVATPSNGRAGASSTFGSLVAEGGLGGTIGGSYYGNGAASDSGCANTTAKDGLQAAHHKSIGFGGMGAWGNGGNAADYTGGGVGAGGVGAGGGAGYGSSSFLRSGAGGRGEVRLTWLSEYLNTEEKFQTRLMVLEVVDLPATDGVVPVPRPYYIGEAGLWFGVEIETMPISIGASVHEQKRIVSVTVNYKNTAGLIVENIDIFNKSFGCEMLDRKEPLETGTKKIRLLGYNKRTTVQIRQDAPLPMTLLSLDMDIKY